MVESRMSPMLMTHPSKSPFRWKVPDVLTSPEALKALRADMAGAEIMAAETSSEPEWAALRKKLAHRHRLDEETSGSLIRALERLWLLPFHRYEICAPLLVFHHVFLPRHEERFRKEKDRDGLRMVRAFGMLVEVMLQGVSVFPGDPVHLAQHLMTAIHSPTPSSRNNLLPTVRLLVSKSESDGFCGFNRYRSENPNAIALYERKISQGRYEGILKSPVKMRSYEQQLEKSETFRQEWTALKRSFRQVSFRDDKGIVRRSPIPERNWRRDPLPNFRNPREAFQAAFDLFCWKWFLYGMKKDEPLVQKPFYVFTPYGTQLFIPGYMSMDPTRDIDWREFNRLHRARGVARQDLLVAMSSQREYCYAA